MEDFMQNPRPARQRVAQDSAISDRKVTIWRGRV